MMSSHAILSAPPTAPRHANCTPPAPPALRRRERLRPAHSRRWRASPESWKSARRPPNVSEVCSPAPPPASTSPARPHQVNAANRRTDRDRERRRGFGFLPMEALCFAGTLRLPAPARSPTGQSGARPARLTADGGLTPPSPWRSSIASGSHGVCAAGRLRHPHRRTENERRVDNGLVAVRPGYGENVSRLGRRRSGELGENPLRPAGSPARPPGCPAASLAASAASSTPASAAARYPRPLARRAGPRPTPVTSLQRHHRCTQLHQVHRLLLGVTPHTSCCIGPTRHRPPAAKYAAPRAGVATGTPARR